MATSKKRRTAANWTDNGVRLTEPTSLERRILRSNRLGIAALLLAFAPRSPGERPLVTKFPYFSPTRNW